MFMWVVQDRSAVIRMPKYLNSVSLIKECKGLEGFGTQFTGGGDADLIA